MQTQINLTAAPNQTLSATITDKNGDIHIADFRLRTMPSGFLITDITIDDVVVVYGRRCIDRVPLMLGGPIGGNFFFVDQFGTSDPEYTGFGDRYILVYDDEYELG
ncbi:MAG: hypothetical protein IKD78_06300 [Bacteroidales bacterium]|nr:hypothetical protein [Bacteroidales bacterium]